MASLAVTNNNATANGETIHSATPHIILYTNHRCPYAHRAHIALEELKLPFEEVIIDLNAPRPQWYLDINSRGLVPAIKYSVPGIMENEVITESQIVAQFLCDNFPSHLLPASNESPLSALRRARINFFVDTWNTKVSGFQQTAMRAGPTEKDSICKEWAIAMEKEIEPLLNDAAPFFGGSKELTFAEVMAAPFLVRWCSFARDGELLPATFLEALDSLPNISRWRKAIEGSESVMKVYNEKAVIEGSKARIKHLVAKSCVYV